MRKRQRQILRRHSLKHVMPPSQLRTPYKLSRHRNQTLDWLSDHWCGGQDSLCNYMVVLFRSGIGVWFGESDEINWREVGRVVWEKGRERRGSEAEEEEEMMKIGLVWLWYKRRATVLDSRWEISTVLNVSPNDVNRYWMRVASWWGVGE